MYKYILYFDNGVSERVIGRYTTIDGAYSGIRKFCEDRHFKIYYMRVCKIPNRRIQVDVGSHTQFFYIETNGDAHE